MAYKNDLQKYYVGFYGRPADPAGLTYWNNVLEDLDVDEEMGFAERFALIKEYFAGTAEEGEQAEYDLVVGERTNAELVDMIYWNLFGRGEGEEDGRDFWVEKLDNEESTLITIVNDIIGGIEEGSADEDIFNNRLELADYFTNNLGTKLYGRDDIEDAQGLLFMVTDDPDTLVSAKAGADEWIEGQDEDPGNGDEPSVGQTFTLTTGADRGADFVGTADNDTYEAPLDVNMMGGVMNTFQSADVLDGAGGRNDLWATVMMELSGFGGPRVIAATTKNIQELYFEAVESGLPTGGITIGDINIGHTYNLNNIVVEDDLEFGGSFQPRDIELNLDLPAQSEVVSINARKMLDVDYIESYYSDADLAIYGLTTNVSAGNNTRLADMTVAMNHTSGSTASTGAVTTVGWLKDNSNYAEYLNGALEASSMKVLFEQNYLVPTQRTTESEAYYWLLDQDGEQFTASPLFNIDRDGIQFTLNGEAYEIRPGQAALDANTWAEYADALRDELAAKVAAGAEALAGIVISVDWNNLRSTFNDAGDQVEIPAITLTDNRGGTFADLGFTIPEDLSGEFNVFGRFGTDPAEIVDEPIKINVELEKVGRGADGGGLIVGGDNYTKGFDEFDVYVRGNIDQPSSLAYLLTTPHGGLNKITIKTHDDYLEIDNPANLTIGNSNTPVYSILDVNHFDARDFKGVLELYYAAIVTPGAYRYDLGTNTGDTLSMNVVDDALNTANSGLVINGYGGNNTIHVDYLLSNGSQGVNTNIATGSGNDTIVLSNMEGELDAGFLIRNAEFAGEIDFPIDFWTFFVMLSASTDSENNPYDAHAAKIETGGGNDAIFLNGHTVYCNADTTSFTANPMLGTFAEEFLSSIGLTNIHPWFSVENWAPGGNVFPFFDSKIRVTFAGIESDWVSINSSNFNTELEDILAALKTAVEGNTHLSHLLEVNVNAAGGGALINVLTGGEFGGGDLSVEIQGPNAALNQYNWDAGGVGGDYDPQNVTSNPFFGPLGPVDYNEWLYFPGLTQGGISQVSAQNLYNAWLAYYPDSDVSMINNNTEVDWDSGEVLSNFFGDPESMTEFLEAVQQNAQMTASFINFSLAMSADGGSQNSSGVQYVNAGSGEDTIVLPYMGITWVEFTGQFDTTAIVIDHPENIGNLRLDFTSYLDTTAAGRGQSVNETLDGDDNVKDGFVPIPVLSVLNIALDNAGVDISGIETAAEWNGIIGGGQHNSITYFNFSDIWNLLEDSEVESVTPPNSFANFNATQLQSALNYWLDFGGGSVRSAGDYEHFIFGGAGDLNFDNDVSVLGAKFLVLVGKDGEVIQEYRAIGDTDYADPYENWSIDEDYATGEMKVFTGQVVNRGTTAEPDLGFGNVELQGVVNLATTDFDFAGFVGDALSGV